MQVETVLVHEKEALFLVGTRLLVAFSQVLEGCWAEGHEVKVQLRRSEFLKVEVGA